MTNDTLACAFPGKAMDAYASSIELTESDIVDAMRQIPGYLDISVGDFLAIYHQAHRLAMKRRVGN